MTPRERDLTHAALAEQARAERAEAQRDRLRVALNDLLANTCGRPGDKSCGHSFYCSCPFDAASAALEES